MPLPVWNRHSSAPVVAFQASMWPSGSPAKTTLPAVARTEPAIGYGLSHDHASRPAATSNAFSDPVCGWLPVSTSPPHHGSPSRKSAGPLLYVARLCMTGTYMRPVFGLYAACGNPSLPPEGPGAMTTPFSSGTRRGVTAPVVGSMSPHAVSVTLV